MRIVSIIKYKICVLFLFSVVSFFGQEVSVKNTPTGNGPFLDAVTIKGAMLTGWMAEPLGTMIKGDTEMYYRSKVGVDFQIYGNITQYRYKGVTYRDKSLPNLHIKKQMMVKATVKIKTGNTVLTQTEMVGMSSTPPASVLFQLDNFVKAKSVSILSIKIEPVDLPIENNHIEWCLKQKEEADKIREQNEKEVVAQKDQDDKEKRIGDTDDDFWNGATNSTQKRSNASITSTNDNFWNGSSTTKKSSGSNKADSNEDFWNGSPGKTNSESESFWSTSKKTDPYEGSSGFKIMNNEDYINGKYVNNGWVEDANGNIIIPKGNYHIERYQDGLAKISKITGYDQDPEIGEIKLVQYSYLNAKGEIIPPIIKTIVFPYIAGSVGALRVSKYHYGETYSEMEARKAREERAEEERKRKKREKERKLNEAKARVKAKYRAMGYEID